MVVRRTRRSWKVIGITEWSKEGGREEMGWDGMRWEKEGTLKKQSEVDK